MACVNPDGTVSALARGVLEAIAAGTPTADLAAQVGRPLFQIRASLRELVEAGLLEEQDSHYTLTGAGRALL